AGSRRRRKTGTASTAWRRSSGVVVDRESETARLQFVLLPPRRRSPLFPERLVMKRLLPVLLVLSLASCSSNNDPKKETTGEPNKETAFRALSLDRAVEAAKKENKIVLIDFYADWCQPCKMLDGLTFSDEKVKQFLKDKAVAIKINTEEDRE